MRSTQEMRIGLWAVTVVYTHGDLLGAAITFVCLKYSIADGVMQTWYLDFAGCSRSWGRGHWLPSSAGEQLASRLCLAPPIVGNKLLFLLHLLFKCFAS